MEKSSHSVPPFFSSMSSITFAQSCNIFQNCWSCKLSLSFKKMKVLCSCAQSVIHNQENLVEVERSRILDLSHASSTESMSFVLYFFFPQSHTFSSAPNSSNLFIWKIWPSFGTRNTLSPGYSCGMNLKNDSKQLFPHSFFHSTIVHLVPFKVSEAHGNVTDVVGCETGTCIVSVTLYSEQIWGLHPVLNFYQLTNLVY